MKKKIAKLALVLFGVSLLSGCGDSLYEMTEEERGAVVSYASHVVAKYNSFQQDGLIYVSPEEETESTSDKQEPEEDADDEEETTQTSHGGAGTAAETSTETTLSQALDLGMVHAVYTGAEIADTYEEGSYYSVEPENGKQFLIVHVDLANQAATGMHVDILAVQPSFQATVNGEMKATLQASILLDDLSTYQGDIGAGETVSTVLLFQVPTGQITNVENLQLQVTVGGNKSTINL